MSRPTDEELRAIIRLGDGSWPDVRLAEELLELRAKVAKLEAEVTASSWTCCQCMAEVPPPRERPDGWECPCGLAFDPATGNVVPLHGGDQ